MGRPHTHNTYSLTKKVPCASWPYSPYIFFQEFNMAAALLPSILQLHSTDRIDGPARGWHFNECVWERGSEGVTTEGRTHARVHGCTQRHSHRHNKLLCTQVPNSCAHTRPPSLLSCKSKDLWTQRPHWRETACKYRCNWYDWCGLSSI